MSTLKRAKVEEVSRQTSSTVAIPLDPPHEEMNDMEKRILSFIQQNPECDANSIQIGTECPEKELAVHLQRLSTLGEILVYEDANKDVSFQVGSNLTRRVACLSPDARAVYTLIENAGDMGIWHKIIRSKTNMEQQRITRAVKVLVSNQFIKEFYPVNSSKKKHYMLYHLQPATEVDGGTFYDKGSFDGKMVDTARHVVIRFLEKKLEDSKKEHASPVNIYRESYATVAEVTNFLKMRKVFLVTLSERDMDEVFHTLVHENKITPHPSKLSTYRLATISMPTTGVATTPCGQCPVRSKCAIDGVVNPITCEYMAKWLDF
eukprot:m.135303 g.135303  ORF g.135303 m.135303 type:complete len:319 (+) comp9896_c0_seq1:165-1121(+)